MWFQWHYKLRCNVEQQRERAGGLLSTLWVPRFGRQLSTAWALRGFFSFPSLKSRTGTREGTFTQTQTHRKQKKRIKVVEDTRRKILYLWLGRQREGPRMRQSRKFANWMTQTMFVTMSVTNGSFGHLHSLTFKNKDILQKQRANVHWWKKY